MRTRVSSFDVTLDTCVLLPITLCDTLLRFAEAGFYRPHWSEETLAELTRNLQARFGLGAEASRKRIDAMNRSFPEAVVTGYRRLVDAMPNDPKDRHVLAAAVKSSSQVVVTSNLRDFSAAALAELDIEPQSPDLFLLYQSNLDPLTAAEILRQQASEKIRPPMTVAATLDRLAVNAPRFADAMRLLLGVSHMA